MAGNGTFLLLLLCAINVSIFSSSLLDGLGKNKNHDRELYHAPSLLALDYRDFLQCFKVFVYPPIQNASAPDLRDAAASTPGSIDRLFVESLLSSVFVTGDPDEAHFLFLPTSISALWKKRRDSRGIAHSLKAYVQQLRDLYPYWQRSLGADHFFVSCHDITSDWSRNVLELKKNAIQVACFPLAGDGNQEFFAHKDITMPQPRGSIDSTHHEQRLNLAFYDSAQGQLGNAPETWESDEDFITSPQALGTSKFCLSLGSSDRHVVLPALRSGCIPVIFSSGKLSDLPFQDILDWNCFAIILGRDQLHATKEILESIERDEEKLYKLQHCGARAAKHMEWHSPPREGDAFYMVLYQLWRRRHVIRYVDQ